MKVAPRGQFQIRAPLIFLRVLPSYGMSVRVEEHALKDEPSAGASWPEYRRKVVRVAGASWPELLAQIGAL